MADEKRARRPIKIGGKAKIGSVTSRNTISSQLERDYVRLGTWRAVGEERGISAGMALRVARQGYEPKDPVIRGRLGLSSLVLAQPCTHCGQVHEADVCYEQQPAPALHPVTIWARRVRPGAIVLARSRRCARRRCGLHFVPVNASQRYCSPACAERKRKRTKLVRSRRDSRRARS